MKRNDTRKRNIVFAVIAAAALALCLWKCFYGFKGRDESFYFVTAQRLAQGDALFSEEWNLSQQCFLLLVPFVRIYETLFGGEGILLGGRIVYTLLHFGVSSAIYFRLRKYGSASFFAALSFFIFTPLEINTYFYNNIVIDTLTLTAVILSQEDGKTSAAQVLCGVMLAMAVMCSPPLVLLYAVYFIYAIVRRIKKNDTGLFREMLCVTAGAGFVFVCFMCRLLSATSVRELLRNIPPILADPDHINLPFLLYVRRMIYYYTNVRTGFEETLLATAVLFVLIVIDKKRSRRTVLYLALALAISAGYIVIFFDALSGSFSNMLMMPPMIFGFVSYMLLDEKPKKLFMYLMPVSWFYALELQFTSNQYFFVLAMAMAVTLPADFVFMGLLIKQLETAEKRGAKASKVLICFMAVAVLCMQVWVKLDHCYWEAESPLTGLKYELDSGPAKHLHTDKAAADEYGRIMDDLAYIKNAGLSNAKLLVYDERNWIYLEMNGCKCACYSGWLYHGGRADGLDRLEEYYNMHPDALPEVIYIVKDSEDCLDEWLNELGGQREIIETDTGYIVLPEKE